MYFSELASRMGTPYLQSTLNRELSRHIQETLPSIRSSLRKKMLEIQKQLKAMPDTNSPTALRNSFIRSEI